MSSWPLLTPVDADTLVDARLQLHHAAQIVTAVGISYLPPRPDDSHTGFTWRTGDGVLLGEAPLPNRRFALRPRDFTLLQTDETGRARAALPLHGETVDSAYDWVRERLVDLGLDPGRLTSRKHYEIPDHMVAAGAVFDGSAIRAFEALGDWYEAGSLLASGHRGETADPGVRIWPHHFDIARLNTLRAGTTIGVGMVPGDASYASPYVYLGPYPHPDHDALPALPAGGTWHTAGWFGAVLTSQAMWQWTDKDEQEFGALAFVDAAYAACAALLGS